MKEEFEAGPASQHIADLNALFGDPLWVEVFAGCCHDTGEVLSMERARSFRDNIFAQNPNDSLKLSLRGLRIGATAVSCLALQIKGRHYTAVDLSENQLSDHAMLSVRSLVRALPELRMLGLSANLVGSPGMQELADELRTNSSLEVLVMGESDAGAHDKGFRVNAIGSEGLRMLLSGLQANPQHSLTSLSLCNTSLDSQAGKYLAAFLEDDPTLQHLNVSSNPLTSEGVCAVLQQSSKLRMLDIADTGCRGDLIHARLVRALQRSECMTRLSLARNPFDARSLSRVAKAAACCESLVSLSLEAIGLDTEGVTVLADALLAAPGQSLTELDLSDNQLTMVEAATALAHVIGNSVIQVLRLNRNALGDAGVREIGDALDPNVFAGAALQQLELGSCRIGPVGAAHLFTCIANNEDLRFLRLTDNHLDDTLDINLIDRLNYIQDLLLSGNRLSHNSIVRAAQTCERNRQRARDRVPNALRAEVHKLLFQETKRERAKDQVAADIAEIEMRTEAREQAAEELRQLRLSEAEHQKQLSLRIAMEEDELAQRRVLLTQTKQDLVATAARFEAEHRSLRKKLAERESYLADLQVQSQDLDDLYARRQVEHPREVASIKSRIKTALADAEQLQQSAREMRQQLRALQDKSLIDFRT